MKEELLRLKVFVIKARLETNKCDQSYWTGKIEELNYVMDLIERLEIGGI